ncbi:MAG: hypothetical protein EXR87_06950 [Gammaproteobacteria bacterium]|nr:hypothetical protein [Gammaproteobacteria bacterium]
MTEEASLSRHAAEQIRYIRAAMAGAIEFTAVPGRGLVVIGVSALPAAMLAQAQPSAPLALLVWSIEGALALLLGVLALQRKARRLGLELTSAPGRKFMLALLPAGIFTLALSSALWWRNVNDLVPAVWLAGYGTGVIAAGAHSVPAIPLMGGTFLACGMVALLLPASLQNLLLALSFGGLHIAFGAYVARHHGG